MHMSEPEFERTVTEAVRSVPERFKKALSNIAITVADEPTDKEYVSMTHGDGELLGLYQGTPITQRTTGYAGVLADRITIFKGPHERICATHAQMVEQIRKTVLHELGHYFGFDDKYLHSHGY